MFKTAIQGVVYIAITLALAIDKRAVPQANCTDGMHCQQYADFFCNPSNPSGLEVCPITCKNPRCVAGFSSPVPTTTRAATTVALANYNCTDGMNCQQYADFFCSPSNPSGKDVCPITCKNPRCVSGTKK